MNFIRKTFLTLFVPLLTLLLLVFAIDFGLVTTATQPKQVKDIIASSGIYKQVMPDVLSQAQTVSSDSGTVPLSDPAIKSAAETAFSPSFIQSSTNQAIDSIYQWLNGHTAQPDFKIDLSANKAQFATLVGQAAQIKAESLPACTTLMDLSSYSVFTANCLPKGITPASVATSTINTIQGGQGFLEKPVISASSIKSSGSDSSIFTTKLRSVPKYFQWAKKSPFILAILALLVGTGVSFLAKTRRAGLKIVAYAALISGVLLLALAWAVNFVVHGQVPKISFGNQALLSVSVRQIITNFAQAIDKNYWWVGGIYAILGVGGIGALTYWRRPIYKAAKSEPKKLETPTATKK